MLDVPKGTPPLVASTRTSTLWHISSEIIAQLRFYNFTDPDIDRSIEAAARQMDADTRLLDYENISVRLAEERGVLPLIWIMDLFGVRRELEWTPRSDKDLWAAEMRRERPGQ